MNNSENELVEEVISGGESGENKLFTLIADLLVTEAWKDNVFPRLTKHFSLEGNSIKAYMTMYHEASLINLLEVLMFHKTSCEEADDALVELIDYCHRKLIWLMNLGERRPQETPEMRKTEDGKMHSTDHEAELKRQFEHIEFQIAIICISILRFISDHMPSLSVPIVHAMTTKNDMPLTLVPLFEMKPWERKNGKGEIEHFEENQ